MSGRSQQDAAIEVDGLKVVRGGREILHGIGFRVARNRVVGLLGPNGSGKSTLIRAILGIQVVAGGSVVVLGQPAGSPTLRRKIGFCSQQPAVYADLTVRENLRYFGSVLGAPPDDVDRVLTEVDLGEDAHRMVHDLSEGELARTNLAVALLGRPELLILDEPTVGLDPLLRDRLWKTFRAKSALGVTVLVSTHIMAEANRCDRLLLLHEGTLLAVGTPEALRERTSARDLEQAFLHLVGARHDPR